MDQKKQAPVKKPKLAKNSSEHAKLRKVLSLVQRRIVFSEKLKIFFVLIIVILGSLVSMLIIGVSLAFQNYTNNIATGLGKYNSYTEYNGLPNNNASGNMQGYNADDSKWPNGPTNENGYGWFDPNSIVNKWFGNSNPNNFRYSPDISGMVRGAGSNDPGEFLRSFGYIGNLLITPGYINKLSHLSASNPGIAKTICGYLGYTGTDADVGKAVYNKFKSSLPDPFKAAFENPTSKNSGNYYLAFNLLPYVKKTDSRFMHFDNGSDDTWGLENGANVPGFSSLSNDGALVSKLFAKNHHLKIGSWFEEQVNVPQIVITYYNDHGQQQTYIVQPSDFHFGDSYDSKQGTDLWVVKVTLDGNTYESTVGALINGTAPQLNSGDVKMQINETQKTLNFHIEGVFNNYTQSIIIGKHDYVAGETGYNSHYFDGNLSTNKTPLQGSTVLSLFDAYGNYQYTNGASGSVGNYLGSAGASQNTPYVTSGAAISNMFSHDLYQGQIGKLVAIFLPIAIGMITILILLCLFCFFISSSIIIHDNKTNIATMKVLGYSESQTLRATTNFFWKVVIIGILIALPIFFIFFSLFLHLLFVFGHIYVPFFYTWWELPVSVIILLVLYAVCYFTNLLTIKRLSSITILKEEQ